MMGWQWLELDLVLAIHQRQVEEHGGLQGIRDQGLLVSALARPKQIHAYGENDVFVLAAAYGYAMVRNHPFFDGNKRTAYVLTRLFLKWHGEDIKHSIEQKVLIFERLAAGTLKEPELILWLRESES